MSLSFWIRFAAVIAFSPREANRMLAEMHNQLCEWGFTGCYLSVRRAGKQDWVLLVVVDPYTRMIWAEWCAKALGRIPFIASRSDARSTRCGRSWPAETLGVSRHHWLLIARQRKSLQVFILCTALESVAGRETSTATVPGTSCSVTENRYVQAKCGTRQ